MRANIRSSVLLAIALLACSWSAATGAQGTIHKTATRDELTVPDYRGHLVVTPEASRAYACTSDGYLVRTFLFASAHKRSLRAGETPLPVPSYMSGLVKTFKTTTATTRASDYRMSDLLYGLADSSRQAMSTYTHNFNQSQGTTFDWMYKAWVISPQPHPECASAKATAPAKPVKTAAQPARSDTTIAANTDSSECFDTEELDLYMLDDGQLRLLTRAATGRYRQVVLFVRDFESSWTLFGQLSSKPDLYCVIAEGDRYPYDLETSNAGNRYLPPLAPNKLGSAARDESTAKAQHQRALAYQKGDGVARDYLAAVRWYRQAAQNGYAPSATNLGVMYQLGQGIERDYGQAAAWYKIAADLGDADAQANLGMLYHQGLGVPLDYSRAAFWYRKAAAQGDADARSKLEMLQAEGRIE
jgi:hypothetical protein